MDYRFSETIGCSGGVVKIWDRGGVQVDKDLCDERFVLVKRKWSVAGMEATLSNVYVHNAIFVQKILWMNLLTLKNLFSCLRSIRGDYNTVKNRSERSNCVSLKKGKNEFNNSIDNCKMVDLTLTRKKFSWYEPNNKRSRLDQFLLEEH